MGPIAARGWILAGVAAAAAALSALAGITAPFDARLLDAASRALPAPAPAFPVVLVAIDEPSLEAGGRWPWPRERHARLLDHLAAVAPAAVAFDILFAEPDPDPAGDRALAAAMARLGRVVLAVAGTSAGPVTPALEVLPTAVLAEAAAALGHTNVRPDGDGRVRRLELRAGLGSPYWPALAVAALGVARGHDPSASAPVARDHPRAWTVEGEILPPWPALWPHVRRLSFAEALESGAAELPREAVVVVGATAAGLAPAYAVPDGFAARTVRGAELQAAAVAALASGAAAVPVAPWPSLLLAALLAALCAPAGLLPVPRALALGLLSALTLLLACTLLLARARLWWAPGPGLLGLAAALAAGLGERALRAHLTVRALRLRCELALRSIGDAVVTVGPDGRVLSANAATARVLGVEPAALEGTRLEEALRRLCRSELPALGGPAEFDLALPADGRPPRELRATLAPLRGPGGRGLVATFRDVTAERQLVRDMAHRATHDALTGLPNRALLDDRLESSLHRARRSGQGVAVAFLDLDRFKAINDGFGHAAGDRVLQEIARRLHAALRESDTVGRIGGDEFVVILEGLENALAALAPLERMAALVAQPVEAAGQKLRLSASVGVASFPRDAATPADLLRFADLALYRAKQTGRDRIVFYAEDMNHEAQDRLWLERELAAALERDGVFLHYQPRFALGRRQLAGFECLARWEDPERGAIPPARFIPVAEETGLICPLGRKIVAQAAAALSEWRRWRGGLALSINLSVVQLKADDGFVGFVADTLAARGLDARQLEFEITESLFLDPSLPMVDRRLRDLAALGVRLAIDDFGTGYSSLNYLHRLPFNAIKIDRSFVRDIAEDARGRAIIEAIVGLGRSLDKRLVAEGVETEAQLGAVTELGCHEAQGYLLGRPQPAAAVPALLAA